MQDENNMEKTFIYQLSKNSQLKYFKNILLLSSFQDSYAPYDSARMQISSKDTNDWKIWANNEMASNLLDGIPIN